MSWAVALILLGLAGPLAGQDDPKAAGEEAEAESPVHAYTVGELHPVGSEVIAPATILVQDGKIKAFGKVGQVAIPEAAVRHDMSGQVVIPGFVHAAAATYTGRPRLSASGNSNSADRSLAAQLRPSWAESQRLARAGFTTALALPSGGGFPGRGALVRPVPVPAEKADRKKAPTRESVLRVADSTLVMGFARGTRTKKRFADAFTALDAYKKALEAFKKAEPKKEKAAPEKKEAEKKPASGKEEKPAEGEKKPDAKEEKPKEKAKEEKGPEKPKEDPKVLALLAHLEGRLPGLLTLASATDFLHFESILKDHEKFRPTLVWIDGRRGPADSWRVAERIHELGLPVICTTNTGYWPRTRNVVVPARTLLDRGIPVALVPRGQAGNANVEFRIEVMEFIRHGVSRSEALRAITLTPAELIGVADQVGSIEVGKQADMLFFSGDPFSPTSRLERVLVAGETVFEDGQEIL